MENKFTGYFSLLHEYPVNKIPGFTGASTAMVTPIYMETKQRGPPVSHFSKTDLRGRHFEFFVEAKQLEKLDKIECISSSFSCCF